MSDIYFDRGERAALVWQALLFTVILVFWQFFREDITSEILTYALLFFAASLICIIMHEFGHKFVAQQVHYTVQIHLWKGGIFGSFFMALYTFGRIPLIIGNPLEIDAKDSMRLGRHKVYVNAKQMALISFGGILGSTFAIALFQILENITGMEVFGMISFIAGIHAISSIIPWEFLSIFTLRYMRRLTDGFPGDGILLLRWSPIAWIFAVIYLVAFVLLSSTGSSFAFSAALVFGLFATGITAAMLD